MRGALTILALLPACAWIAPDDHARALRSPPTVAITSPSADGVYYADEPVEFMATVGDAEDPDTLTVAWETDRDGALDIDAPGRDGAADASRLTAGTHRVTATVTDPDGKAASAHVGITVLAANTAPTCAATTPEDGTQVPLGTDLALRASITDPDVPEEWLTGTWASDKDGTVATDTADATGTVTGSARLSAGVHALTFTGADERGATCSATVTVTVGDPPTAAITVPADGFRAAEGTAIAFEALVDDPYGDPSDGEAEWSSDHDGVFGFAVPDTTGILSLTTDVLSVGAHVVTLTYTSPSGLSDSDTVELVVDGAPTLSGVRIAPAVPVTGEALEATPTATDPEDETLAYTWTWTKDGVEQPELDAAEVPAGRVRRGEVWTVSVTASDGYSVTAGASDSVTIGNAAPLATFATIGPTPLTAGAVASVTLAGTDADGDPLAWDVTWTVNGVVAGADTTLSSGFVRGDTVAVSATPSDGEDAGAPAGDSVVVANAAPAIASVAISPSSPEESVDDLQCVVSGADPDGDALTWTIAWEADGAPWTGTVRTTDQPGDTIRAYDTLGTATWTCSATAADGIDSTTSTSDSVALRPNFAGWGAEYDVSTYGGVRDGFQWIGYGGAVAVDTTGDGAAELVASSDHAVAYAFSLADLTTGSWTDSSVADTTIETTGGNHAVAAGDVEGDGVADDLVLFGADGQTYVTTGPTLASATYLVAATDADWVLASSTTYVAGDGAVADVDGDGCDDIVVSSSYGYEVRVQSGRALGARSTDLDDAEAILALPTGDWWGISVAARDFDGDGLADLVVGSDAGALCAWPGDGTWPGAADLCTDGLVLTTTDAGEYVGERVQPGGDVDGDGTDDLLVPFPYDDTVASDAGRVYVVRGGDLGATGWTGSYDLASSWVSLVGDEASDALGWSSSATPAATADVDGDGLADVLVSSGGGDTPSNPDAAAVWLFLGDTLSGGGTFGASDVETAFWNGYPGSCAALGSAGDLDGNGFDDLWIAYAFYYDQFWLLLSS